MKTLEQKILDLRAGDGPTADELALAYLRYERLRLLTTSAFEDLNRRNRAGENFDEMVDNLILLTIIETKFPRLTSADQEKLVDTLKTMVTPALPMDTLE